MITYTYWRNHSKYKEQRDATAEEVLQEAADDIRNGRTSPECSKRINRHLRMYGKLLSWSREKSGNNCCRGAKMTALTIHGDGRDRTGWMELYLPSSLIGRVEGTEAARWLLDHHIQGVELPKLPRYSKQTHAFLRSQHRKSRTVHTHKRTVSTRRAAIYKRKPHWTHHKWRLEHGTMNHYIVYPHGYEVLVNEPVVKVSGGWMI